MVGAHNPAISQATCLCAIALLTDNAFDPVKFAGHLVPELHRRFALFLKHGLILIGSRR